ncbi:ankyrin repeat-containing domain protein [Neocallimastix lanati (nom. inval.)]|nr:ankyrin repeat-containing domain protein [Neocallimastix sp. JGI-2020a]
MYEKAVTNNNNEAIKTLLKNESNKFKAIKAIIEYDLLEKATNSNDFEFIQIVLKYRPFHYKYSDYESIFLILFEKSEHENTDGEVDDIVKLLIKTFIQESIKKRKEITVNDDFLKLNEDVCFRNLILNIAIRSKNFLVVKYLIKSEDYCASIEDINTKDVYNEYPVITALNDGNFEIFKYLLDHGADCNTTNNNGFSLFMISVFINKTEEFEYLIYNFSNKIKEKESNVIRALSKASNNKNMDMEDLLINYCISKNINIDDYYNKNIIIECDNINKIDCNKFKSNEKIKYNKNNQSIFFQNLYNNNLSYFIIYFNSGIKRTKSKSKSYPLYISYKKKYIKLLKYLLEFFDINNPDEYEFNILYEAIKENNITMVKCLIRNGADVNFINSDDHLSAFNFAASKDYNDVMMELLKHDWLLVNQKDLNGDTPLIYILKNNKKHISDIVKQIICKGANVNLADNNGNTPLTYAILNENYKIIKLLIENGADMYIKNTEGKSPFDYSFSLKSYDCIEYLYKNGYEILNRDKINNELICNIISSNNINFLKDLVNDYNIDLTNYNYPKPILYMAIYKKKYDILEYLINQKLLNPNIGYNYINKGYKKYFSNAFSFNEYCNSHMNDFIKINNILNRYK